jgi:hypothetical protein
MLIAIYLAIIKKKKKDSTCFQFLGFQSMAELRKAR